MVKGHLVYQVYIDAGRPSLYNQVENRKMADVMEGKNGFYKRLALVGSQIPCGKVATYGQLALLCGRPRNSRQVGYALNRGLASDLPAHRIVNSQGILSGSPAFDTPDMQRLLLEKEGVPVKDNRVDLKKYAWDNTMEDALYLKTCFEEQGI